MGMSTIRINRAKSIDDIQCAREMFVEYAHWLAKDHDIDLAFQNIDHELTQLPGKYSPPGGEILLARNNANSVVGVIALRPYENSICEIKRLYVLPQARGYLLGKRLISEIIAIALQANYKRAILDTAGFMHAAQNLYEQFGFTDIPAYYNNPVHNMRFMGVDLNKVKVEYLNFNSQVKFVSRVR